MKYAFLALFTALLFAGLANADCKSFVKDGFPLGIMPNVTNLSIVQKSIAPLNTTLKVYIEGDATSGNLGGCRVFASIEGVAPGSDIALFPTEFETGLGWKDANVTLTTTPKEPYADSEVRLKLQDLDDPNNAARVPITIRNSFKPPTPTPAKATVQPSSTIAPSASVTASPTKTAAQVVEDVGKSLEQDASRYLVLIFAVVLLGLLLWVGFRTLQKD